MIDRGRRNDRWTGHSTPPRPGPPPTARSTPGTPRSTPATPGPPGTPRDDAGHAVHPPPTEHAAHAGHDETAFARPFWVSLVLTVPILLASDLLQDLLGYALPRFPGSEWLEPVLASVVYWYGGWVFLTGAVADGRSELNESMITGESRPVDKGPGDPIIAGTVNGSGSLRVRVTRTGEDTALAGIMRLVAEAQTSRTRAQALADRAASWLTLVAVGAAALALVGW
jgi:cation transport ATPase